MWRVRKSIPLVGAKTTLTYAGRQTALSQVSPKSAEKLDRGCETRLHKYAHYGLTTAVFEMDHPLSPHIVRVGGCLAVWQSVIRVLAAQFTCTVTAFYSPLIGVE